MSHLHVICKVAESEYAIPAEDVVQMESYSPITKVPGTPPYVAGLIQIRQKVVPIINLRARFGLPSLPDLDGSRFVILKLGTRQVGLLVDSAREVREISPEQFQSPEGLFADRSSGFIKAVAQFKERIIMLIDSLKVVGEESNYG